MASALASPPGRDAEHGARASRPPVPAWGAERIVRAVLAGQTDWRVAADLDVSVSTVRTLVKVHRETGEYREPQQGKGRRDDPRWIFAGPNAPGNLLSLEHAFGAGPADDLIEDIMRRHRAYGLCEPAYSTVARALRDLLDITGKRLTGKAYERDPTKCDLWMARMLSTYTADQLICIDETCAARGARPARSPARAPVPLASDRPRCPPLARRAYDNKTANRRRGRAKRGHRAKGVVMFHKGTKYSALGVLSLEGMLDCHVTQGAYTAKKFRMAFKKAVVPNLRPYPEPCSVVVLDNCPNLHTQRAIVTMVQDVGARLEWLEPYDPHHMPIEIGFRSAKDMLRSRRDELARLPRRERLRTALMRVGRAAARSAFHECGYVVPPDA